MSYCIIPKNNIDLELQIKEENIRPFISSSVQKYLTDIRFQYYTKVPSIVRDEMIQFVNPLEYINNNVTGYNIAVSKNTYAHNLWFELFHYTKE